MDRLYDPFRFNKQTASLLRGLGASELIPECKKRNISTHVLHELSAQELIMLGASPQKAEEIRNALDIKRERSAITIASVENRIQHFFEIIKHGKQRLSMIQLLVVVYKSRLLKERINFFIDVNKCLSASQILPVSVNATLAEVEEARKKLCELEQLVLRSKVKPKCGNTRILYVSISIGLVTFALLKVLL